MSQILLHNLTINGPRKSRGLDYSKPDILSSKIIINENNNIQEITDNKSNYICFNVLLGSNQQITISDYGFIFIKDFTDKFSYKEFNVKIPNNTHDLLQRFKIIGNLLRIDCNGLNVNRKNVEENIITEHNIYNNVIIEFTLADKARKKLEKYLAKLINYLGINSE